MVEYIPGDFRLFRNMYLIRLIREIALGKYMLFLQWFVPSPLWQAPIVDICSRTHTIRQIR